MARVEDQELIAWCLSGSDAAWEELVNRYSGLIYSVALKYGLSQEDAADVFQTVCLQWWQSLDQLRDVERLGGWLATMTGRAAWRLISGRRRAREHEMQSAEEMLYTIPGKDPLPEEMLLAAERSEGLRRAVNRLEERCRRLITMLFFAPEPPDYTAIAGEFGLAEGSIGSLRKRCLERLRREFEEPSVEGAFSEPTQDSLIESE